MKKLTGTDRKKSKPIFEGGIDNYLENSSIHGLKYISSKTQSTVQRLVWSGAMLIAMGSASYMISQVFLKWRDSPVLMVLSPTTITVTTIPFPALVICNINLARRSKTQQFAESSRTPQQDKKFFDGICGNPEELEEQQGNNQNKAAHWKKLKLYAQTFSQNCSDMIIGCIWKNKISCLDMIEPAITDAGYCCLFNRVNKDSLFAHSDEQLQLSDRKLETIDWTPDRGFLPTDDPDMLPWRPTGSGTTNGLKLLLDVEKHEYYCYNQLSTGIKINAHNPIEAPRMFAQSLLISPGYENRLVVTPKVIMASDAIKSIAVNKRNCYFSYEKKLAFYRTYTENNCMRECQSNYTLATCGCVASFMPTSKEMDYCPNMYLRCMEAARDQMFEEETRFKNSNEDSGRIINIKYEKARQKQIQHCNCIPGCNDITYGVTVSKALLLNGDLAERTNYIRNLYSNRTRRTFNATYFRENVASLEIYFDKMQFTPYERKVLYTFSDLVANIGGLLGLFLGFSILSLAEIIYFILLKVFGNINKDLKATSTSVQEALSIRHTNNWEQITPIERRIKRLRKSKTAPARRI